jgi:hypothetical protein
MFESGTEVKIKIMDLIFSKVFWGIFIILFGVLLLVNSFTTLHLPVTRIMISLFLVTLGISLLLSNQKKASFTISSGDEENTFFSDSKQRIDSMGKNNEFNTFFSSQVLDLRNLKLDENKEIEVNVIFSSQKILINSTSNVRVVASSVFGSAKMDGYREVNFGDGEFKSSGFTPEQPHLLIKANVVFGSVRIFDGWR